VTRKTDSQPEDHTSATAVPLAIVGIGCLFPGASDPQTYWTNIRDGVDAITEVPPTHWNPDDYFNADKHAPDMTYARRGGFINPVDFDPLLYGLSPNNIEATDTTQLLGMVVARQALLDAGYATGRDSNDGKPFDRNRTSVILGVTGTLELVIPLGARLGHPIWRKALADAGVDPTVAAEVVERISAGYVPWQENSFPGLLGNVAAGRIANRFDLGGTNCVVDAACASSLSAIHLAALELYSGRSDMAITGGFDTFNDIFMYMCFSKTPALSPTGNSKPFDSNGDGTILGEGLGAIVLKRLADAERDGDNIYAVLRGIGSSSDGRGNAIYAPSANGQTRALKNAYREAGISPATIELVEAHGTGTRVGDAVEAEALSSVYREAQSEGSWCAIGSVKSMIGHTKAAAGVAGLIKVAMALKHKVLPPTIKVGQPLDILSPGKAPVYVNTVKRPWLARDKHPRRGAISAFGFGGSNFHCVLEEAPTATTAIDWDGKVLVLGLSADSRPSLLGKLNAIDLKQDWNALRTTAARSLQQFNSADTCRLLFVITAKSSLDKLFNDTRQMLQKQEQDQWSLPEGVWFGAGKPSGKLAMLFPGQGSQYPDMLLDLACQFPQIQSALSEADQIFSEMSGGEALGKRIYPIPVFNDEARTAQAEALRATRFAQPAIGAVSLGALRVLDYFGIEPDATAGHSFGELTALCAAGRIDSNSLHRLAIKRGELMNMGTGDHGSMLAVSASAAVIHEILEAEQLDLIIANNNAPRQVVLSGATDHIRRAAEVLKKRGLSAKILPVSAAFHSSFVSAAEKPFAQFMQAIRFNKGKVPVYANTTAEPYPQAEAAVRQLLARQLAQPVEFVTQVENMYASGIRTYVETGPGNTLTGLVRSILGDREHTTVCVDASRGKQGGQFDLACALARLAALGHQCRIDLWDAQWLSQQPSAAKKPAMTITLTGANYVKPRPPLQKHRQEPARMETPRPTPAMTTAPASRTNAASTTSAQTPGVALTANADTTQAHQLLATTQQSILALQQMQEQTAELHRRYLEGQQAAQLSIQRLLEQQQQLLSGTPISPLPISAPQAVLSPSTPIRISPAVSTASTPVVTAAAPVATLPAAAPTATNGKLESILLQVIAEKTGYPVEMLSMEMSLDTDLGIDSIKRVEILSGLQERLPGIRKIQPEDLGTFRLLKNIIEYLAEEAEPPSKPVSTITPVVPTSINTGLNQTLLEVVAEKTGYPVDMLRLDMNLDTDLGIDSIKRVEILSAFQERMPDAPTVNPEDMAALQTLQQIVDYMQSRSGTGSNIAQPVITKPVTTSPVFDQALLAVVAEKTGYPVDMLRLEMNLDTDLGIDSIKRVEILSAFQERMPDAPTVNPEDMAALQTLQQIVEYMQGRGGATAAPVITKPGMATPVFDQALLAVVAEKTGYPVDMLRLDMNLDTDLGIDSIKRVEILSAFQERMPDAPTVNPEHMATLQTLQQIVDYMQQDIPVSRPARAEAARVDTSTARAEALWRGVVTVTPLDSATDRKARDLAAGAVIHVTDSGDGLSTQICQAFNKRGYHASVIAINDRRTDAISGLVIVAPAQPQQDFLADAFELLRHCGTALKQAATTQSVLLAGISGLGGHFAIDQRADVSPLAGGLAGLIKTADKEWPQVRCRIIDTDYTSAMLADSLVDELLHEGPLETGLRDGQSTTLTLIPAALDATDKPASPVSRGDVIVISGGARGITAEIAVELAANMHTNLLLLGRSPVPAQQPDWLTGLTDEASVKRAIVTHSTDKPGPKQLESRYRELMAAREIGQSLDRIRASGVKAEYRSLDIRNAAEVGQALAEARRALGPIRGIIHGAGVLADRRIEDKTRAQFDEVCSTKIEGLQALLQATQQDDLKLLVLFSSSTARFGRKGQIDYAAANEMLNKTAQQQQQRRPHCRVLSVNWGPWDGGMVTAGLKKVFEGEGVGVIPLRAGAQYLMQEIATPGPVELVILGSAPLQTAAPDYTGKATSTAAANNMTVTFERTVSLADLSVLQSHVMNGKAVLPTALIAEWLAHGAMHDQPGLGYNGFDNLAIYKGVILDIGARADLQILAGNAVESDRVHRIPVELRQGKLLHAGASIVLGTDAVAVPAASNPAIIGTYSISDAGLYSSGRLFHGKELHGIEAITGYSDRGISARVRPAPNPSVWMKQPIRTGWLADPLALDSAFQLMILWCFERTGNGSLPTRIGKYRQYRRQFPKDGTLVNLLVESAGKHEAKASIEFVDMQGKLVARIDGYECVIDVSLNEAFRRNRLETEPQA
jgi:acyl transferase domain-containing protein